MLKNAYPGRIESITPLHNRGCQLSLIIQDETLNGKNIYISRSDKNVIGDWREPNVIRMAPAPLYNSFEDVFEPVERLKVAVQENKVK